MADQQERIVLDYDPGKAVQAAAQANAAIASNEKAAERVGLASQKAASDQSDAILRIVSTSKRQVDSIVASAEKRASALKNPLDQLQSQKQFSLDKVAGDPEAVRRVAAAYDQLAAAEKAAAAADKALAVQSTISSVEQRVLALKSPLEQLLHQKQTAIDAVIGDPAAVRKVAGDFDILIKAEKDAATAAKGLDLSRQIKDGIENPVGAAGGILQGFINKIGAGGVIAGAALLGIGVAAKEAFGLIRDAGRESEEIVNLGDKLGVTAGQAAVLNAQARIAGVGVDSLGGLVRKLSTNLTDGGQEARSIIGTLNSLGVSVAGLGNSFRNPVDILRDLSGQISRLPDRASQVDLLTKAFGRGAVELLPLILHFKELEEQAKSTGVGGLDELYKRMQAVDDKLDVLSIKWQAFKIKLAEKVVSIVEFVVNAKGGTGVSDSTAVFFLNSLIPGAGTAVLAKNAAGALFESKLDIKVPTPAVPDGLVNESQRRGNVLERQFHDRQTPEGVQEKLADLAKQRDQALARIVPGRDEATQKSNIAAVQGLDAEIEKQKELLKILSGLPEATRAIEQKRREEIAKSQDLILENEKKNVDARAKIAIDALDTLGARDILSARQVEDEKLNIQKDTIDKVAALEKAAIETRSKSEIDKLRSEQKEKGIAPATIERAVQPLTAQRDERLLQVDREAADARNKADDDLARARIVRDRSYADQSLAVSEKNIDAIATIEARGAERTRDQQLDSLALVNARTVADKIAVEQKRFSIESDFLKASERAQFESVDRRLKRELDLLDLQAQREGISDTERLKRRQLLEQEFQIERQGIAEETDAAIASSARKAAIDANRAVQEYNLSVFDSFKRQSEGIFDAMQAKGQNVFQAIGNAFKNAMLTAIKDVVSSRVAAALTELVTGQKVTLQSGNTGAGPLGKLAGQLGVGAVPTFGNKQAPVELKTKLDLSNHLGDLQLRSGAAPVYVVNPQKAEKAPSSLAVDGLIPSLGAIASRLERPRPLVERVTSTLGGSDGEGLSGQGGPDASADFKSALEKIILPFKQPPPVELKTKLDLSNHLGDLQLKSGAAPVYVVNVGQPKSEGGRAASALEGLAPVLGGIAVSLGNLGSRVPAGAVSSTIDFGAGAVSTGPPSVFGAASQLGPGGTSGFAGPLSGFGGSGDLGTAPLGGFGGGPAGTFGGPSGGGGFLGSILKTLGLGQHGPETIGGLPGGTPGADNAAGTTGSGGGIFGGLKGLFGGGKNILSSLGNIGMDKGGLPGVNGAPGTDLGGGLFGGHGIGGAGGGALLAGGGILAYDGLRRGGIGGLLETTAGGAAIGAKFGGPIGALIGAGVGAIAGTVRLFVKSANEKIRQKVKDTYKVDISDKGILTQIANIAKQSYGGDLDIAIRAPEVRQLIELYGMTHGQDTKGIVAHAQASVFSNTGGVLSAQPTFFDGQAVLPGQTQAKLGTPRLTPNGYVTDPVPTGANTVRGGAAPQTIQAGPTTLSLDAAATTALLQGQAASVIAGSPRLISQTASTGMGLSAARRDIAANTLNPSLITA